MIFSDTILSDVLPFWDKLDSSDRQLLTSHTAMFSYKKGENIHGGNGKCTGAIIVREGSLRAYMLSEDGREITLYRMYSGDMCMLSASCVLKAIDFDVMVDADEDCECLIISGGALASITERNMYAQNFALSIAVSRFSDVMWVMQQVLFMSFDRRLAIFLYDEFSKSGNLEIMLTHEQIAVYTGSAREVVSRMLKYFASEKITENLRGGVRILDKKRLFNLARGNG